MWFRTVSKQKGPMMCRLSFCSTASCLSLASCSHPYKLLTNIRSVWHLYGVVRTSVKDMQMIYNSYFRIVHKVRSRELAWQADTEVDILCG